MLYESKLPPLHDRLKQRNRKSSTSAKSSSSQSPYTSSSATGSSSSSSSTSTATASSTPIPVMPSQLFQQLALSQLELLASAIPNPDRPGCSSKIKSMALYLPQENTKTGQLEFLPAVLFPHPNNDRIFIANDADSRVAPKLPKHLTTLPGFANANSLLPAYPMVSSSSTSSTSTNTTTGAIDDHLNSDTTSTAGGNVGVGVVEEVLCDLRNGGTALSVPLFVGSRTVGVLLVSPAITPKTTKTSTTSTTGRTSSSKSNSDGSSSNDNNEVLRFPEQSSFWTNDDRKIVARAAKSLSLALALDNERNEIRIQNEVLYESLSDSLHQFKNPLQALRTFGKLLQQRIADSEIVSTTRSGTGTTGSSNSRGSRNSASSSSVPQLLELTGHLMVQSDRLVARLKPVDDIVELLGEQQQQRRRKLPLLAALNPANDSTTSTNHKRSSNSKRDSLALVPWRPPLQIDSSATTMTNAKEDDDDDMDETNLLLMQQERQQQQLQKQSDRVASASTTKKEGKKKNKVSPSSNKILNVTAEVEYDVSIGEGQRSEGNIIIKGSNNKNMKLSSEGMTDSAVLMRISSVPKKKRKTKKEKNSVAETMFQSLSESATSTLSTPLSSSSSLPISLPTMSDMELQMSFVMDVLEPILTAFNAIAAERGISFHVVLDVEDDDDLPGVMVCPQALQEVFTNVLDNAFKYVVLGKLQHHLEQNSNDGDEEVDTINSAATSSFTPLYNPNPQVLVTFVSNHRILLPLSTDQDKDQMQEQQECYVQRPAGVTIIIEDNGPGIPSIEIENGLIFERGYRNEQMETLVPGKGIGLCIAKTLMVNMGGTINVIDPRNSNTMLSLAITTRRRTSTKNLKKKNNNNTKIIPVLDGAIVELVLFR